MTDLDVHLPSILRGDAEAFGAWMRDAEPALRGALRSFARTVDVEAVIQETLLRTWQVAPRLEPDGRPNTLLRIAHRIGRNLAISETRKRRVAVPVSEVEPVLEPRPPDPMLREAILRCRAKLPEKPRAALEARLSAAGGESDDSLAARLSMKKNTFLQNFGRARRLLAECLKKSGVDLEAVLA